MSTTTIRIDDNLKLRIANAAERAGKTAHAFILDAITETVVQVELVDQFHQVADQRWANIVANGKTMSLDSAKSYAEARARGEKPRRPVARKLAP